jgi:hypothetical protein
MRARKYLRIMQGSPVIYNISARLAYFRFMKYTQQQPDALPEY